MRKLLALPALIAASLALACASSAVAAAPAPTTPAPAPAPPATPPAAAGQIKLVVQRAFGKPPFVIAGSRMVVRGIVIPYVGGQTVNIGPQAAEGVAVAA